MKNTKILISALLGRIIHLICSLDYEKGKQYDVSFASAFNIHKLVDKEYEEVGRGDL